MADCRELLEVAIVLLLWYWFRLSYTLETGGCWWLLLVVCCVKAGFWEGGRKVPFVNSCRRLTCGAKFWQLYLLFWGVLEAALWLSVAVFWKW